MPACGADGAYSTRTGTLTVYSDIACPWATLALHNLRRERDESGVPVRFDHRAFPLELVNRRPTSRRGLDRTVPVIAGLDPSFGWQLWQGPEAAFPVTTLPAMEAVQAAKDPAVGGLAASDELDGALRRALFADSRCVSLLPVVLDVAEDCRHVDVGALREAVERGEGRAAVIAQWRAAVSVGVRGSPQVYTPDGTTVHNPGVRVRWTGRPRVTFPVVVSYDRSAYCRLVQRASAATRRSGGNSTA